LQERFQNIINVVKHNEGLPLTKELLMQFVQRDVDQTNEDIEKLISEFIALPEEERAEMVSNVGDDEDDANVENIEAMDSISSIGVLCYGCVTYLSSCLSDATVPTTKTILPLFGVYVITDAVVNLCLCL
jgi:hypothetical protein